MLLAKPCSSVFIYSSIRTRGDLLSMVLYMQYSVESRYAISLVVLL